MTLIAAVLLLVSTWLHAGWNLLSKQRQPTAAFFLAANTIGCLGLALALVLYPQTLGAFTPTLWGLVGLTGFFQAVYYIALAGAYRSGDLSVAYPLARSFAVVVVPIVAHILGQGKALGGQLLLGMAVVAVGCLLVPLRGWREWRWQDYWRVATLFALLAGSATAGYSIVDDVALRQLRAMPAVSPSPLAGTLVYALFEGLSASLWLALYVATRKPERAGLRQVLANVRQAALTGVGIFLAYTLVLIAMAFVRNISYVVAFRQLGILWGALLGVVVLREPRTGPKLVGVLVLIAGLVLVGTG